MHRFLPTLILALLFASGLRAQEVLTDAYFPEVGDTLRVADADSASRAAIDFQLMGGTDLSWYFGDPNVLFSYDQAVSAAASDPRFPQADLIIDTDAAGAAALEFYQTFPDRQELVGLVTTFDLVPGFSFDAPVSPARIARRTNLNYGDTFNASSNNTIIVPTDSLPQAVLDELGSQISIVDSLRITTISSRFDTVDAYGTVRLFDNFYPVIREKRTETLDVRLEVRTAFTPWLDVTASITLFNPDLQEFLGPQPVFDTYYYWNNDSKEAIAVSRHVPATGESRQMTFKRAQTSTSTRGPSVARAQVRLYPNPAANVVTLEVEGLRAGRYHLDLISMTGRRVAQRQFSPRGNLSRLTLDLGGLPNGLYLYSLRDDLGRIVTTKKLQVRR